MNKSILCVALGLLGTIPVHGDPVAFFRIQSPGETVFTSVAPDGMATWSNAIPEQPLRVQRTSMLGGASTNWSDYLVIPATGRMVRAQIFYPDYLVIDLSEGPTASNYPVLGLDAAPSGGWTDEYKTTKLVLRRIPAGSFIMGSPENELGRGGYETQREVILPQPFYIGVFEVTQKQWERVMGTWPSYFSHPDYRDSRPVEQINFNLIRGPNAGAGWPADGNVEADSFMGRLRTRTRWPFDLPTETQWEYACRAGTSTALNSGRNLTAIKLCPNLNGLGRYGYNGGKDSWADQQNSNPSVGTPVVGSYLPNAWGLYDFHGGVSELCLDYYDQSNFNYRNYRVVRGGGFESWAEACRSAARSYSWPNNTYWNNNGLRIALPPGAPMGSDHFRVIELTGDMTFGAVFVGESASRTLTLRNAGIAPLTVTGIDYPSGFSGNWTGNVVFASGSLKNISVTFRPTEERSYDGTITVRSDADAGDPSIRLIANGVTPEATRIIALTGNLIFGAWALQDAPQRILTLRNTGNSPLTVSRLDYPAGFSGDWAGGSVPAGGGTNVAVTFQPLEPRTYTGTVTVVSNATEGNPRMSVSGLGIHAVEPGMVMIEGGTNAGVDPDSGDYSLTVDSFLIGRTEVTKAEWDAVRIWAVTNGYSFYTDGSGKEPRHPVHSVCWFDMAKWCNARSEMEGRIPVYYTGRDHTPENIFRRGSRELADYEVRVCSGYRLPMSVEWEYAAHGGRIGARFPWGDTIDHERANYAAHGSEYAYDTSSYTNATTHPLFNDGTAPYTSPAGVFATNGYGLFDMAGNVQEWCWDRAYRGGSWLSTAAECRVAEERYANYWNHNSTQMGFRLARSPDVSLSGNLVYGAVATEETVNRTLTIANLGNRPLTITSLTFPTGLYGDWAGGIIEAGGFRTVTVTFNPTQERDYQGRIAVSSNLDEPVNRIAVSGTGVASRTRMIEMTGNLSFGGLYVGDTFARPLTIFNAGTAALTVSGIDYPAGFSGDWAGGVIDAGCSRTFSVTFAPTEARVYAGTLTVTSNAGDGGNTIAADGAGLATIEPPRPEDIGMVLIPGGTNSGTDPDGMTYSITVESFYMGQYEVTKELWDEVREWNDGNGYEYENPGEGKATNHPVYAMSWYDAVKWCNARSQMERRRPVYYTDAGLTEVFKQGRVLFPHVDPAADGYRLPSGDQWHYAARGGAVGRRFPWSDSDFISHERANYYGWPNTPFDLSVIEGYHPAFDDGVPPYTSPVGSFAPNDYGLYDMAGNANELCFDAVNEDGWRMIRGGSWSGFPADLRVIESTSRWPEYISLYGGGFRVVLPY